MWGCDILGARPRSYILYSVSICKPKLGPEKYNRNMSPRQHLSPTPGFGFQILVYYNESLNLAKGYLHTEQLSNDHDQRYDLAVIVGAVLDGGHGKGAIIKKCIIVLLLSPPMSSVQHCTYNPFWSYSVSLTMINPHFLPFLCCHRLFGNSGACSACGQSIPASELVMRAQGNVYHLKCFTCSTCRNRLVPGDRFHYINGSLFCEHDRPTALINGHLNSLQSNPLLPDQKVNT
ncbi:unnamed protein product [Ranitomeya imitator]|uniref:LIM zinc-binding domain-containing protein n=1 Tax=Ranitomeya imitator TaxID=111125 RepID=A0ABN9KS16_9NEOB|nr:unnamed protein product [Ranitomeya imitator]